MEYRTCIAFNVLFEKKKRFNSFKRISLSLEKKTSVDAPEMSLLEWFHKDPFYFFS